MEKKNNVMLELGEAIESEVTEEIERNERLWGHEEVDVVEIKGDIFTIYRWREMENSVFIELSEYLDKVEEEIPYQWEDCEDYRCRLIAYNKGKEPATERISKIKK